MREELTWRVHPARERVKATLFAAVAILTIAAVIYVSFQSAGWSMIALLVLVMSLNRFFFSSRFTIDTEGITARYPLRRQRYDWENVRRFIHDRSGGYISTRRGASRLDTFRGMHLLFGDHHETVIRKIKQYIGEAECHSSG